MKEKIYIVKEHICSGESEFTAAGKARIDVEDILYDWKAKDIKIKIKKIDSQERQPHAKDGKQNPIGVLEQSIVLVEVGQPENHQNCRENLLHQHKAEQADPCKDAQ